MIREAIDRVKELGVEACAVQQLTLSGDRPGVSYLFNRKSGELKRMQTEVAGRAYKGGTLSEFAAMVKHWGEKTPEAVAVFVDGSGVTAVLDEGSGRREERLSLKFTRSDEWDALSAFDVPAPRPMSQRDFVWVLRTVFKDRVFSPIDLLGLVRTVKFKSNAEGETTLRTGKESISSAVVAEMQSSAASEFPEEVSFRIPVFEDLVDEDGEECAVEVDGAMDVRVDKQEFLVRPIPGELAAAERRTLSWVQSVLTEKLGGVGKVFIGSPA